MSKKIKRTKSQKKPLFKYSRWNRADDPPVKIVENYLKSASGSWADASKKVFKERIYKFYRWLETEGTDLQTISYDTLERYEKYLQRNGVCENSIIQYRKTINTFIRWLDKNSSLENSLVDLNLAKQEYHLLLEHLKELTQSHAIKIHKIYVHEFYTFLKKQRKSIHNIEKSDVDAYELDLRNQNPARPVPARRINMRCVRSHLHWLAHNGYLRRSLGELGIFAVKRHSIIKVELPNIAEDFLRLAFAYKSEKTVRGYKTQLKHFYKFLGDRQISITKFSRRDFEEFARSFQERGYSPVVTNHAINAVQIYLSWLYECGHLKHDPEPIIGNFPRPRRPEKLPRYLYPEVDDLIQQSLKEADNVISQALYLMRRTGIRIGDLRNLEYDCLRQDERGYSFMKVPIGKLNNERLFPLDKESIRLLKRIKKMSRKNNGGHDPEKLVVHPRGRPPGDNDYHNVLFEISEKIRLDNKLSLGDEDLVSHRLRHTFATTLINAGIELEALRDLLGHRSIAMTLVYAKVAPTKLRKDYLEALERIEKDVRLPNLPKLPKQNALTAAIEDALFCLKAKLLEPKDNTRRLRSIIRRVERLKKDLVDIK